MNLLKIKKVILFSFLLFLIIFGFTNISFAQKISDCNPQKLIPVKYKQSGYYVKNLQLCLIKIGINIPSGATGYYGKQTIEAVKEFYKLWYGNVSGYSIGQLGIKKLKELVTLLPSKTSKIKFERFKSEKDFMNYLLLANKDRELRELGISKGMILEMPAPTSLTPSPERVSETTVQIKGIDEPDIVKTDGYNIYFSKEPRYVILRPPKESNFIPPYPKIESLLLLINAFPVENLRVLSKIDKAGDLLLLKDEKILIIFDKNLNKIYGYDISEPQNPKEKWSIDLKNTSVITARLFKNKIYLATKRFIEINEACPIKLFLLNNKEIILNCKEIYHPNILFPTNALFVVSVINPKNGEIEKQVSFLGSTQDSVFYMSYKNIYLTYSYNEESPNLIIDFLTQLSDLLPSSVIKKLSQLKNYEISSYSKLNEIEFILENYSKTLNSDEVLRIQNEIINRFKKYYSLNKRKFEKTIIVKINNDALEIDSTGEVPGYPLNQFSLDEYNDNLRIAVTIGERFWEMGLFIGGRESVNDVYILDKNLKVLSYVLDLGKGERIYSVRFIEDKGYVVTFRETDPFYVLDLSNPQNPVLKGELKIPGWSSYLHPITKDKILGIGKDGQEVKISLFDVSNPENPIEKDKYVLSEYWSEVLNNFHAFLLDDKHQIFFLPASNGGYIFSYKDDKLNLVKSISNYSVKRAIYINDYLYVISENKIIVLDEKNFEVIKELSLEE